jgi:tetratricopeptide (TPR) repeat protein
MGLFQKLFRREQKTKEDLMSDIFESTKDVKLDMKSIEKLAREHPDRMIFQDVKNPEEFQMRNHALYFSMNDDYKKAIEYATKGIKVNPKSAYLFYIRGRSKGDIELFDDGVKDLDEAIKLKPDYADAFVERGYIEQKKGNLESAKKDYEKAKKIDPSVELGYMMVEARSERRMDQVRIL